MHWLRVLSCAMSKADLKPYLLQRFNEMKQRDPSHLAWMRNQFIAEFGKVDSIGDALADADKQEWWLHWFGEYRCERLRKGQAIGNKKAGSMARR